MSLITDEIFYNALRADEQLMEATHGIILSTSIEVPPLEHDNTPLPYIVVMFDGMNNEGSTKDDSEGDTDNVTVSIEISAESRREVGRLAKMARQAVRNYFRNPTEDDIDEIPTDYQLSASGVGWDDSKPCYHQLLTYQCTTDNDTQ